MKKSVLFFLLLPVLLAACSLAADVTPPPGYRPPATQSPAFPISAPDPASGEAIYAEKCAPCHGESGQGDGPQGETLKSQGVAVPALGSPAVARAASPEQWYAIVTDGSQRTEGNFDKFMPGFSSLSAEERWNVVAYAFSLSAPAETLAQGQALFQDNCVRCHGLNGQGNGPDAAGLAASPANFTDQSFMARRSAANFFDTIDKGTGPMPAFGGQFNDAERWALTAYLRSLSFTAQDISAQPQAAMDVEATDVEATGVEATDVVTATQVLSSSAPGPVTGTVTGWVSFPAGMSQPAELPVNLIGLTHEAGDLQMSSIYTSMVQPSGSFVFSNVPLPAEQIYGAVIRVDEVVYNSELTIIPSDTLSLSLPITVTYTTDLSALAVNRLHMIFDFSQPEMVQVMEIYVISNSGPTVLAPPTAPEMGGTVRFSLPQGATNLMVENERLGGRFMATEDGFADTQAIYPGPESYQLSYAYILPYPNRLNFSVPVNLPVAAVTVLLSDSGVQLSGDKIVDNGVFEGTPYRRYDAANLSAGSLISFQLTGKPGATETRGGSPSTNLAVGLGVFGAVLIAAGVWLYSRGKKRSSVVPVAANSAGPGTASRPASKPSLTAAADDGAVRPETLMDAILALDDIYQSGKMPEAAYRDRRAQLKAELKRAMEGSNG